MHFIQNAAMGALFTGTLFMGTAAAFAQSTSLTAVTGWDDRYEMVPQVVGKYAEALNEASGGEIALSVFGPESVAPKQQFETVAAGAFDINFTVTTYHMGRTPVSFGLYALDPDVAKWREVGIWDYIDAEYQSHGLKLLGMFTSSTKPDAFQIMLKEPLTEGQRLDGRKVRGGAFFRAIVEPLGGALVGLNIGETYASLQKGVVDGAAGPIVGAVNLKWHEVTGYMARPAFGASPHLLLMNLDKFESLPGEVQTTLLEEAEKLESSVPVAMDEVQAEEIAKLRELGVAEVQFDEEVFSGLMDQWRLEVWGLVEGMDTHGPRVKEFHDFVRQTGLSE